MKHYETAFILKPTLVEEEIKSKIDFFRDVITKNGGEIIATLDMGMRTLAYEIKKHARGYYFVIYFRAEPKLVLELERNYRINEDVLRFLTIKYEGKKNEAAWQALVDNAQGKGKVRAFKKPSFEGRGEGRERGERSERSERAPRRESAPAESAENSAAAE